MSVNNQIVNNLTTTNISATDAVVQNLQVTNVSVTDQTVTGTLSVNNEIVTNLTATNFSSTDAVIQDLTVTNCMGSLCVNSLSIVDQSISGSLSVNNEVINGNLTIPAFTPAGVVHNDGSGLLSSSLIVNADITDTTISNAKLATISSTNTAGNIVVRDGSGNFATNMITLNGTVTNPTDAATKNYVDTAIGGTGTSLATPNTLVLRDGTASFAAAVVSVTDAVASGDINLTTNISTSTAGNINKGGARFIHNFGTLNTFVGASAGNFTMTGTGRNTAVGYFALTDNTTGHNNAAFGTLALSNNTTGIDNVAVGSSALLQNSIGWQNTAIGRSSMQNNTTGRANTAVGQTSLMANAGGVFNVAIGGSALFALTSGDSNTALGSLAGQSLITGSDNIYIGSQVVAVANESNTTRIGVAQNNTYIDGIYGSSTPAGSRVVVSDTTGKLSTTLNITVTDVVASGDLNLTTNPSTATDGSILKNGSRFIHNFGSNNTFMGLNAGNFTLTGNQNVGVGVSALSGDTSGYENTAVGYRTLIGNNTGFYNVAVGTDALFTNSSGQSNTAIGWNALLNNNTGSRNTAVGTGALLGTGSDNIAIGNSAGASVGVGSFNIYIGNTGAAEGNTIRIGTNGLQTRNFQAGIYGATIDDATDTPVLIDASGQLGTVSSSRRYKHNIEDMGEDSANILELRPVTFAYNSDASEKKQYGLIAEEVNEIFPEIVVRNADGQVETVRYHVLPVLLLNEMQKQQTTIQEISQAVTILQGQMQQLIN